MYESMKFKIRADSIKPFNQLSAGLLSKNPFLKEEFYPFSSNLLFEQNFIFRRDAAKYWA
jgi:hypothetical protein